MVIVKLSNSLAFKIILQCHIKYNIGPTVSYKIQIWSYSVIKYKFDPILSYKTIIQKWSYSLSYKNGLTIYHTKMVLLSAI